jgi:hypothetical protein
MLDDSVLNQQFQHFPVGYLVPEELREDVAEVQQL